MAQEWDNVGGNQTILSPSTRSGRKARSTGWSTLEHLLHQYFGWRTSTDSVFYFDVPVSEYDCEVRSTRTQYHNFRATGST